MSLRLCPRASPSRFSPFYRTTRQFTSIIRPRIIIQQPLKTFPPLSFTSLVFRRNLFGMRKQTTDSATKVAKSAYRIAFRFTVYSGVFIVIVIAGFFIYDVHPLQVRLDVFSLKHIIHVAKLVKSQFLIWLLIHVVSDRIIYLLQMS